MVRNGSVKLNKATNAIQNDSKSKKPPAVKVEAPASRTKKQQKQKHRSLVSPKPPPTSKRAALRTGNGSQKLPSGTLSKGLRAPKNHKSDQIHSRLKNKSPWYSSITDPLRGADAKIPDEVGVDTGTLQLVQKLLIHSNAQGCAGFKTQSLYVNSVPNAQTSAGLQNGSNWQELNPVSGEINIDWGAYVEGTFTHAAANSFTSIQELKPITAMHRIVSAGLYVQPEPSLATNQGELTMFVSPFDALTSPVYDTYMNHYKSSTQPINANKAGKALWFPIDRDTQSFKMFFRTDGNDWLEDDIDPEGAPFWQLGFMASGLDPTITVAFRVTVVVNYEFVPINNTLNVIDSSPSPTDAVETDLVENWVQDMDVTGAVSQRQVSVSPATVEPQHGENDEGTGFGMFFNVLTELMPVALALL